MTKAHELTRAQAWAINAAQLLAVVVVGVLIWMGE